MMPPRARKVAVSTATQSVWRALISIVLTGRMTSEAGQTGRIAWRTIATVACSGGADTGGQQWDPSGSRALVGMVGGERGWIPPKR